MLIFKIFRTPEWEALQAHGETFGAPIDLADGYIHFSSAQTVKETAAKHFSGADGLWLVALDADTLGDKLVWEPSRGGALFPHLYRALSADEIFRAKPLPLTETGHHFEGLI